MKRFWDKVDRSAGKDACWPWTGSHFTNGYGQRRTFRGTESLAHRWAWLFSFGEIPTGKFVLHNCDVRDCCNPKHLRLGDHADNMRDMVARGRSTKGVGPKLTPGSVKKIRALLDSGAVGREIAEQFGISPAMVTRVKHRDLWAWVS